MKLLVSIFIFLIANPCLAKTKQNMTELKDKAYQIVTREMGYPLEQIENGNIMIKIGHIDSRLNLTQCENSISGQIEYQNRNATHLTIMLQCQQNKGWKIRLPVKIRHFNLVVVPKRPIKKGHLISKEDLTIMKHDVTTLNADYFIDPEEIIGKQAKRSLAQRAVIKGSQIKEQKIIRRGDIVNISAKLGALTVLSKGEALTDGTQGQVIKVKNTHSKRIIEARIVSSSEVIVY